MAIVFAVTLAVIGIVFAVNVINVKSYNNMVHCATYSGTALFSENAKSGDISVSAIPRGSSWTKAFDLNNEGLKEHNYQAYTYDITVSNNTKDEVRSYSFKLTFGKQVFLLSGWNGSVEIHQKVNGGELVSSIPDLRDYKASEYAVKTVVFDGDTLISMKPGDYLVYYPSTSDNAVEMPIAPHEGTVPGFILYTEIGTDIGDSTLEISYKFHRVLTTEPLFWISAGAMCVWLIALIIFVITSAKIRKYRLRHERDNKIINESIETFTGFIDAKDPYTNGHSKRVAKYTRFIAEKMGYEGEELDRIYYVALLHDCGKIGVPDNILGKPGKLTDEEFKVIAENVAHYHHERYDGSGYPDGLKGKDIPLEARIMAIADVYDALVSKRVYKEKMSFEKADSIIMEGMGTQFDPELEPFYVSAREKLEQYYDSIEQ